MSRTKSVLVFAVTVLASSTAVWLGSALPASAKIQCNGPWQIIKGHGQIATPYCGDSYLAKVARGYGFRVTPAALRADSSQKDKICRLIGHDNRIDDICAGISDPYGRDSGR